MLAQSHTLEEAARSAEHTGGIPKVSELRIRDALFDNSSVLALLTSSSVPGLLAGVLSSGVPVVDHTGESIEWAGAEGNDSHLYWAWEVPEDYDEEIDALAFVGYAWKHDTGGATDNTDAAIVAVMYPSHTDIEAAPTGLVGTVPGKTTALHTLQAMSTTADYRRFVLDFSLNTAQAKNRRAKLTRGDKVYFRLDLNENIGTSLAVLLRNCEVHYRASFGVWNKLARQEFGNA